MAQSITFAYFGDGKFIGWYADSFGSIRPNSPKLYSSLESMLPIITKNFQYKVSKLEQPSDLPIPNPIGGALINGSLNQDKTMLSQYSELELRAVPCPIYDGPDPDNEGQWIYADYSKVKEWALQEPTEFLTVIKSNP